MRSVIWLVGLGACFSASAPEESLDARPMSQVDKRMTGRDTASAQLKGLAEELGDVEAEPMAEGAMGAGFAPEAAAKPAPRRAKRARDSASLIPSSPSADHGAKDANDDAPTVRQWFPESFLWQPLVETDASGQAVVPVRVPDQLTTWRVLALAHARSGQQAGTTHTFDSRLPLYVDPVVPAWMYSGDELQLPVQVVNTTADPLSTSLTVDLSGSLSGGGLSKVDLVAGGSWVERVDVEARGAGAAKVSAVLAGADAVEREVRVLPEGRPVSTTRGGTLAGPRVFSLPGADGADPATEELRVVVFPGPLSVLQSEIERAGAGGAHPWDPAYTFALAARLEDLGLRTASEVDADAVRALRILGWQRVVREARSPDAGRAADLLASMQDVEDHELAAELRARLVRTVVAGQRADGTWSRQGSGTLQLVLAQTAFAARVLPETETGARLRAAGVLERHLKDVKDPYTAAIWLASGVVTGSATETLRAVVLDAVEEDSVGARTIAVPGDGVVNPWGVRPSQQELLAWVSLALAEADLEWHGDLVARLMSRYDAAWGFGAGAADVVALEAVTEALPGVASTVPVSLALDGEVVGTATLDPAQPRRPIVLVAPTGGADPEIRLEAPGAKGLAFVATVDSWVPWTGEESLPGVDVQVETGSLRVGEKGRVIIRLSAPSGTSVRLEQGLPAGALLDEVATRMASSGLAELGVSQGQIKVRTRPFRAGEVLEVHLIVSPAFAGSFATRPLKVQVAGRSVSLPPVRWEVSG